MTTFGLFRFGSKISCTLSGSVEPDATEAEVVAGTENIILSLSNAEWKSGAAFDAERQAIIDGLVSAGSEADGWNAEVLPAIGVGDVVRTSNQVVTISLPAVPGYDISADETITATVPASAIVGAVSPIEASPTFTIEAVTLVNIWLGPVTAVYQGFLNHTFLECYDGGDPNSALATIQANPYGQLTGAWLKALEPDPADLPAPISATDLHSNWPSPQFTCQFTNAPNDPTKLGCSVQQFNGRGGTPLTTDPGASAIGQDLYYSYSP